MLKVTERDVLRCTLKRGVRQRRVRSRVSIAVYRVVLWRFSRTAVDGNSLSFDDFSENGLQFVKHLDLHLLTLSFSLSLSL